MLRSADAPTYCYAYYPSVDTVAHHHGTRGEAHAMQVAEVCDGLSRAFATLDDRVAAETFVCLVADHGQVNVETRVDLAETAVLDHVPTDRSGTPLVLGGPRNVHLRTGDPAATRDALADCAPDSLVLDREEALDADLWGPGEPGAAFARNCGDLVVVPRDGLIWHGGEPDELGLAGVHGGLDPAEALVPFAAARLSDLR